MPWSLWLKASNDSQVEPKGSALCWILVLAIIKKIRINNQEELHSLLQGAVIVTTLELILSKAYSIPKGFDEDI